MRLYLAGPMRGYPLFNFPAFDEYAHWLRDMGHVVLSPAEHDREDGLDETAERLDGFDLHAAMRWDLTAVLSVDAVAVMPGWQQSAGVGIELTVARAVGLPILDVDTLEPVIDTPERAGRNGDSQPLPTINDAVDIQSHVIADITARREVGIRRYGTALQPNNGRNALLDAYEECLDLACYLKQRLVEEATVGS